MKDVFKNEHPSDQNPPLDRRWWGRFVDRVKRKRQETNRVAGLENATDRAAATTARATAWLAVFTFAMLLANGGTLWVLKKQLGEMHDGGVDTHALAVAAGNQTAWTQRISNTTDAQSAHMKELAEQMKAQAGQTKEIAGQAIIQANAAKSAAETASTTLKVSQRPWIVADSINVIEAEVPPTNGDRTSSILGVITFSNKGQSVATRSLSYFWLYPNSTSYLEKNWDKSCQFTSYMRKVISDSGHNPWPVGFLLAPGDKMDIPLRGAGLDPLPSQNHSNGPTVTPEMAREGNYYLIGCTLYDDQLGTTHRTQWCFMPRRKMDRTGGPEDPLAFVKCQGFDFAD